MADLYKTMVFDYFTVIDEIHSGEHAEVKSWDTSLVMLELETTSESLNYDLKQASKALGIGKTQIEHFFVVHACLSNCLRQLIDGREYSYWDVKNHQLIVVFGDDEYEIYHHDDISLLMQKTEQADWSYQALEKTWHEMRC